jgi:hypothetical protein
MQNKIRRFFLGHLRKMRFYHKNSMVKEHYEYFSYKTRFYLSIKFYV